MLGSIGLLIDAILPHDGKLASRREDPGVNQIDVEEIVIEIMVSRDCYIFKIPVVD